MPKNVEVFPFYSVSVPFENPSWHSKKSRRCTRFVQLMRNLEKSETRSK